jgi:hypothetical protein
MEKKKRPKRSRSAEIYQKYELVTLTPALSPSGGQGGSAKELS